MSKSTNKMLRNPPAIICTFKIFLKVTSRIPINCEGQGWMGMEIKERVEGVERAEKGKKQVGGERVGQRAFMQMGERGSRT
jgi:hypothetical protein